MSLVQILLEDFGTINDPFIKRIIGKLEDNTKYRFELQKERDLQQVGYGASAEVFKVMGTGKVLRFGRVSDRGKHNRTRMDIMVEEDFENVVNYYFYKFVDGGKYDDWEIMVMEELEPLDRYFGYTLDLVDNDYSYGIGSFCKSVDPRDPEDIRDALARENEELVKMIMEDADKFDQIRNGIEELEEHLVFHEDLRRHNIMQDPRTGAIKIIDLT